MTFDGKTAFAMLIVVGFLILTGLAMFFEIPAENVKTVDGAMVAIGTALGAAVMALLRTSKQDAQATENTGRAFDAIKAAHSSQADPSFPAKDPEDKE